MRGLQVPSASQPTLVDTDSICWIHAVNNMPLNEEYEATAVAGTTLYVLDGYPGPTKAHKYSCNTDMWSSVKRAPTARSSNMDGVTAAVVGQRIYITGNANPPVGIIGRRSEAYTTITDSWTSVMAMPSGRYGFGAAAYGNAVFVVGGNTGTSTLATLERYDALSDSWRTGTDPHFRPPYPKPPLPGPHASCVLPPGSSCVLHSSCCHLLRRPLPSTRRLPCSCTRHSQLLTDQERRTACICQETPSRSRDTEQGLRWSGALCTCSAISPRPALPAEWSSTLP